MKTLLIINFWDIVENNNVQILDINYNANKKYNAVEMALLSSAWMNIYDEFFELRDNKSGKYQMDKNFEITKLSITLDMLHEMQNRIILIINLEHLEELNDFVIKRTFAVIKDFKNLYPKVKINIFDNPNEVLKIIQSVIKSQTNIYEEKLGVKTKVIEKQKETIFDVIANMSTSLGFQLSIDTLTCASFVAYENAILAKIKSQNNLNNKK